MLGDETLQKKQHKHKRVQTSDSYLDGIKVSRSLNSQANVLQSKSNEIRQERVNGRNKCQSTHWPHNSDALVHFQLVSVSLQRLAFSI